MIPMSRTFQNAASRWAGVGPYYAMFPVAFANEVVLTYTRPGDVVLDPFAGRGTAIFSAATQGRSAIGIEINPVGYVYAKAKLNPASQEDVEQRLEELGGLAAQFKDDARRLPRFFHRCFSRRVRQFLLAARAELNWRRDRIDQTVMALLLVYLHGKLGAALSNQMRQTKSMSPQYAIRWWDEHKLDPPDIDPVDFIKTRLPWRYAKGVPKTSGARMYLANSVVKLARLRQDVVEGLLPRSNLLFTSPPYHAVTNYHYDQWLRLWLLGGPPNALRNANGRGGKFEAREGYRLLLEQVFMRAVKLLKEDATIYVRTDSREFTYRTTLSVLRDVFPRKRLTEVRQPMLRPSQTRLFGKGSTPAETNGEVDLILSPL
jgi:hypothetical protein